MIAAAQAPEAPVFAKNGASCDAGSSGHRYPMPDPAVIRQLIRQRQSRATLFGADMFADPVWDMLLDLAASEAEGKKVAVTSLCVASGVPNTTALRWINYMFAEGLVSRSNDVCDQRRSHIGLTIRSRRAIATYFARAGEISAPVN